MYVPSLERDVIVSDDNVMSTEIETRSFMNLSGKGPGIRHCPDAMVIRGVDRF